MRKSGKRLIALMISALCCSMSIGQAKAEPIELLVPAYFYPNGEGLRYWNDLIKSAGRAPIVVIMNPANGPGQVPDNHYLKASQRARAAGIKVIGYVSTNYTRRARDSVLHDIRMYRDLYRVDGYFIDEMTAADQPSALAYYQRIYSFIKLLDERYLVIGNPGTTTDVYPGGLRLADILVTHENSGRNASVVLASTFGAPRTTTYRDALLAYEVEPGEKLRMTFQAATRREVGMIYLTDDRHNPNPWDSLPSYWAELVNLVCRHNGRKDCQTR